MFVLNGIVEIFVVDGVADDVGIVVFEIITVVVLIRVVNFEVLM